MVNVIQLIDTNPSSKCKHNSNLCVFYTKDFILFLIHHLLFISYFLFTLFFCHFRVFSFSFLFHITISLLFFPYNHGGKMIMI